MKFWIDLPNIKSNFMLKILFLKFHDKFCVWSRGCWLFEWIYKREIKTTCQWSCWQNTRRRIFAWELLSSKICCLSTQGHFLLTLKSLLNVILNKSCTFFSREVKEKLKQKYYLMFYYNLTFVLAWHYPNKNYNSIWFQSKAPQYQIVLSCN